MDDDAVGRDAAQGHRSAAAKAQPVARRRARGRALLALDLSVAASLLLGWLSIPLLRTHIVLGSSLVVLVGIHLATRPHLIAGLIRASSRMARKVSTRRRLAADVVLACATVATAVTGFVQWAGVAPGLANGLHSMTSAVLFGFAIRHVWVRRRKLRQRLSAGRAQAVDARR